MDGLRLVQEVRLQPGMVCNVFEEEDSDWYSANTHQRGVKGKTLMSILLDYSLPSATEKTRVICVAKPSRDSIPLVPIPSGIYTHRSHCEGFQLITLL